MHHLIFGLGWFSSVDWESVEHDYIKNIKIQSYKQMPI